ncbi:MAG: DNA repair protein RecO [Clostridia bacterium]
MSYIKLKGIVTGGSDIGDADRMMTILTAEEGLIRASAKGVRRLKNKLAGATQLFCYGEFIIYPGRDTYSIYNCDIIESFPDLSKSPEKFTYAVHLIKIANDVIQEGQGAEDILNLLLNSLYVISKGDKNPLLVIRIFELRILCLSGFAPSYACCGACGKTAESFSVSANGVVCKNCAQILHDAIEMKAGTKAAMAHICSCEKSKLFSFDVSEAVQKDLNEFVPAYMTKCLEKKYDTLDFLELIK